MFYEVIPTTVFRADGGTLTYSATTPLTPGQLIEIPLGHKQSLGIVLKKSTPPAPGIKVKPITKILHPTPLPAHILSAITWLSNYYLAPLPLVAKMFLPDKILAPGPQPSSSRDASSQPQTPINTPSARIPLNPQQQSAIAAILSSPSTSLLHGITGSGKTNVYLELTSRALASGRSTILLVPEIALTSQLVAIFEETFGRNILLLHSNQTLASRRKIWHRILTATAPEPTSSPTAPTSPHPSAEPLVIIGPRSALLAPVHNLGLILIDECHETTYYQENSPHYSALRLASFMSSKLRVPCVFGSATPSVTDFYLARSKKSLVTLTQKAKTSAIPPTTSIIDLKDRTKFTKNRYFSDPLLAEITKNLASHHQTLIFHNRRGSAPLTLCEACGWQALCPNCYLPMALHDDTYTLICHLCGHSEPIPSSCPNCHHPSIIHKGFGTKLLENELKKLFPAAIIARFDGDNKKSEDLASLYADVKSGHIHILLGTQTLARGLDLPLLASVGIVQADAGLSLPDFAAEERTFELLTQVIGRVGRGHLDTASVIVQTYQPSSPVITTALAADYPKFAQYLLTSRRQAHLPPYTHLARLNITFKTERTTLAKAKFAARELVRHRDITVSPPAPAFHEHSARGFTWQLTLRSSSRAALVAALRPFATQTGFSVILDPPSLL